MKKVSIRLPEYLHEKVQDHAKVNGIDFSASCRIILEEFFIEDTHNDSSSEELLEIKKSIAFMRDLLTVVAKFSSPKVFKEARKIEGFE